ncbi:MAG: 50S ribosomal protein L25 [Bacteroidota bacterium]|nr:50S ribosomal protein L25 [Bacteroidota bacterium]
MKQTTLHAKVRKKVGHSAAQNLRKNGRVPGIFYFHKPPSTLIEVDALDLRPLVYTADTHIVNLVLDDGTSHSCVIKDVQFDPVTDVITHFDLMGIELTEKIRVEVPIVLKGTAIGVREGGVLNHLLHKIEVDCRADELPEHIEIDISKLPMGGVITIGDIHVPNIHIHADPEVPVVTIGHGRHVHEEAPPQPAETQAEPEVIGHGKAEEEKKD